MAALVLVALFVADPVPVLGADLLLAAVFLAGVFRAVIGAVVFLSAVSLAVADAAELSSLGRNDVGPFAGGFATAAVLPAGRCVAVLLSDGGMELVPGVLLADSVIASSARSGVVAGSNQGDGSCSELGWVGAWHRIQPSGEDSHLATDTGTFLVGQVRLTPMNAADPVAHPQHPLRRKPRAQYERCYPLSQRLPRAVMPPAMRGGHVDRTDVALLSSMDSSDLVAPVIAAVVAVATSVAAYFVQREKLRHELRTEFMAESAIVQLLEHPQWKQRSFDHIKARLGGFDDDELRRILVRAGAVRFTSKNIEWWGLIKRNGDLINVREYNALAEGGPAAEGNGSRPESGGRP